MTRFNESSATFIVLVTTSALLACGRAPSSEGTAQTEATTASSTAGADATPRRDISGVWAGPALPTLQEPAPFTPEGKARFEANRPTWGPRAVGLAQSNDPLVTCDPLGFPRSMLYETRGFEFVHTPTKTIELLQYQRAWREIWTDGRTLPSANADASGASPDPRWYGLSVGRWADDYTFVVDTSGADERSWVDYFGRPHSGTARFEERYHRIDRQQLEVTLTVTDPELYTQPYVAMKQTFVRAERQELEEQLCVPSEALDYFKLIAEPAGAPRGR